MLDNNKNFNHLKVHTQYSICEGAIKIEELADYCKSNKIKSIGWEPQIGLKQGIESTYEWYKDYACK